LQRLEVKPKHKPNPLTYFLHNPVIVETEVGTVKGVLIRFEIGYHLPTVLILKNGNTKFIVRGWHTIKEA